MIHGTCWILWDPLKAKKDSSLPAINPSIKAKLGLTRGFEGKLPFLIAFAVIYGLVFINYIDIASTGLNYGYHMWLVFMYFVPFAGFSLLNFKNLPLTLSLGLLTSLMNDVFYGAVKYLVGIPYDLGRYYSLWLIPQNTQLFSLDLGFTVTPVYSWMMALSIYIRIGVVVGLLWSWRHHQNRSQAVQQMP